MASRERLDQLLVQRGLAPSRTQAQALLLAGRVFSEGTRLDKAGSRVPVDLPLAVTPGRRYVGRGAGKLLGAIREFDLRVAGRDVLDVGASTGGFTQVLLEHGARHVIALDVGRGQLDWTLRQDLRVLPVEGCNARWLERRSLPVQPTLATVDVSFISLRLVLPPVLACLGPAGEALALVKPQFEAGRGAVGRGGIVRERTTHAAVLQAIIAFSREHAWGIMGLCAAWPRGADGNREFFLHLRSGESGRAPAELARQIEAALDDAGPSEAAE